MIVHAYGVSNNALMMVFHPRFVHSDASIVSSTLYDILQELLIRYWLYFDTISIYNFASYNLRASLEQTVTQIIVPTILNPAAFAVSAFSVRRSLNAAHHLLFAQIAHRFSLRRARRGVFYCALIVSITCAHATPPLFRHPIRTAQRRTTTTNQRINRPRIRANQNPVVNYSAGSSCSRARARGPFVGNTPARIVECNLRRSVGRSVCRCRCVGFGGVLVRFDRCRPTENCCRIAIATSARAHARAHTQLTPGAIWPIALFYAPAQNSITQTTEEGASKSFRCRCRSRVL